MQLPSKCGYSLSIVWRHVCNYGIFYIICRDSHESYMRGCSGYYCHYIKKKGKYLRPCYFTFHKNITLTEFDDFIGCVTIHHIWSRSTLVLLPPHKFLCCPRYCNRVRNERIWHWGVLQGHNVHSKFHESGLLVWKLNNWYLHAS